LHDTLTLTGTAAAAVAKAAEAAEVVNETPKAKLWRAGKEILISFGVPPDRTGGLIGRWLKTKPDPAGVLAAIQYARDQNVAEPVAYVSVLLSEKSNVTPLNQGAANETTRGVFQGDRRGGGFASVVLRSARKAAEQALAAEDG
jgi:hypothetical protein